MQFINNLFYIDINTFEIITECLLKNIIEKIQSTLKEYTVSFHNELNKTIYIKKKDNKTAEKYPQIFQI